MQRRLATVIAAIAALGLIVAIPASASAKTNKTDSAQNKTLKKQSKSIKSLSKSTKALNKSTKSASSAISALKVVAERGDKNAKTVLDAAPAIIQGLTDLKNGLTAAGAGLNSLKTLATSQEYGYGQVLLGASAQGFIETPDIPDTVQQAQVSQTFIAGAAGTVSVPFGVRSAESDGDGTTAAANCAVQIFDDSTHTTSGAVAPPYTPVPNKSSLTSTDPANAGFPFGLKTSGADADQPITPGPTLAVASGDQYTVKIACVDVTASPTDPSA
jgi:hypothetical protein